LNDATVRALNRINLAFYRDHSAEFDRTRSDPWPGWLRLRPHLARLARPEIGAPPIAVLDAGCGTGRFAAFLAEHRREITRSMIVYRGVDASPGLLARARERRLPGVEAAFVQRDLIEDPIGLHGADLGRRFDATVAFGLLHHVPGFARRRCLIEALLDAVQPGGWLALAFWDFGAHEERFGRRRVAWSELDRRTGISIDRDQLEADDALLEWGPSPSTALRYCHWTNPEEEGSLLENLPARTLERFRADGRGDRLNRYRILQRTNDRHMKPRGPNERDRF